MRVDELADNLRVALRDLPKSMRPKDSDIGAIALLIAEHPAMGRWQIREGRLDFGDMQGR